MRCLKVGKKYFPSFNLFRQISNNCVSSLKIESFLPLSRPPTLVLTLKFNDFLQIVSIFSLFMKSRFNLVSKTKLN